MRVKPIDGLLSFRVKTVDKGQTALVSGLEYERD